MQMLVLYLSFNKHYKIKYIENSSNFSCLFYRPYLKIDQLNYYNRIELVRCFLFSTNNTFKRTIVLSAMSRELLNKISSLINQFQVIEYSIEFPLYVKTGLLD